LIDRYSTTRGCRRRVLVSGVRRMNEVNPRRARLVLGSASRSWLAAVRELQFMNWRSVRFRSSAVNLPLRDTVGPHRPHRSGPFHARNIGNNRPQFMFCMAMRSNNADNDNDDVDGNGDISVPGLVPWHYHWCPLNCSQPPVDPEVIYYLDHSKNTWLIDWLIGWLIDWLIEWCWADDEILWKILWPQVTYTYEFFWRIFQANFGLEKLSPRHIDHRNVLSTKLEKGGRSERDKLNRRRSTELTIPSSSDARPL